MKKHADADEQPVRAESPGFTRFKDAVPFLNGHRYHAESAWRDRLTEANPRNFARGDKRVQKGRLELPKEELEVEVCYHSYPPRDADWWPPGKTGRPSGIALTIYNELLNDRPVGAGFPAYTRPEGHGMTNWTSAFENGIVGIPRYGDALDMEAGHAVCIVGFTGRGEKIKPTNISKGYFVFRNSFGEMFASAPTTGWPQGYGLIKAELVDKCCWEVMFMRQKRKSDPPGEESRSTKDSEYSPRDRGASEFRT